MTGNGPKKISKILSRNDTGETGGHMAGILIPKTPSEILAFFPALDPNEYNPRVALTFHESDGQSWPFSFIYYNNALFGRTRNEYRLTGMTEFMRSKNLRAGDTLILSRNTGSGYSIAYRRQNAHEAEGGVLRLSGKWRVVSF